MHFRVKSVQKFDTICRRTLKNLVFRAICVSKNASFLIFLIKFPWNTPYTISSTRTGCMTGLIMWHIFINFADFLKTAHATLQDHRKQ